MGWGAECDEEAQGTLHSLQDQTIEAMAPNIPTRMSASTTRATPLLRPASLFTAVSPVSFLQEPAREPCILGLSVLYRDCSGLPLVTLSSGSGAAYDQAHDVFPCCWSFYSEDNESGMAGRQSIKSRASSPSAVTEFHPTPLTSPSLSLTCYPPCHQPSPWLPSSKFSSL